MQANKQEPGTGSNGSEKPVLNGVSNTSVGFDECPEIIHYLEGGRRVCKQIKLVASHIFRDLNSSEAFDKLIQWSVRNPHAAICIFTSVLVILFPCLVIFGIGISTLLLTVTGFLILEGVLLTVITTLLLGCLGIFILMFFLIKQIHRPL